MAPVGLIDRLVAALRCLPGVGPKTAQRMAFHLLERDRDGARHLAETLLQAVEKVGHCRRCRTLSEHDVCPTCADAGRDPALLCVVETPADMAAIQNATAYRGGFFVLMGHLSPLDGVGPEHLGIDRLQERLDEGEIREVILATAATVEGQATAHFLSEIVRGRGVRVTRIAQGVPLGGELEYVDGGTLAHALTGRGFTGQGASCMPRHAKSDANKKGRGTLNGNERWGEEARGKRAVDNVVMLPRLDEVPDPTVPLQPNGPGHKAFHFWCGALLNHGILTKVSVGFVENLALCEDKIEARVNAHKEIPDKTLELRRSMLLKLEALDVDQALVPDQKENPFAQNGFPTRLRQNAKNRG